MGIKRTVITAGKYKGVGSDTEPLSKEHKQIIQDRLDYYYTLFVDAVAKNRGTTSAKVLSDMADGRIFIGQQAKDAGMVDEIGSFETAFDMVHLAKKEEEPILAKGGKKEMKLSELKKEDPDGYNALVADVQATVKAENAKDMDTLRSQITEKDAQIAQKNEQIESSNKRILALEKTNAIRDERERKEKAERIWDTELNASDIPEHLHPKVRTQVNFMTFVSQEGAFDEAAFTAAVRKEITDGWPTSMVLGGAPVGRKLDENSTEAKEEKEDDALVDTLFALA
jgi:hypothetical protein